jgi:hypothetical protein
VEGSNRKKGISDIRKVRAEVSSAMRFTNSSLVMRKARTAPRDGRKMIALSKGNRGSIKLPFSPSSSLSVAERMKVGAIG